MGWIIRYKIRAIFLLNEISSSLPDLCVTNNGIGGPYIHLNTVVGLGYPGNKFESSSKGKNKLFCQINWEEFGGTKSRETEEERGGRKKK